MRRAALLCVFLVLFSWLPDVDYALGGAGEEIPFWKDGMLIKDEEIIIGDRADKFLIYENASGHLLYSFGKDYEIWDEITAGDINGDGKAEIIHGETDPDYIHVFTKEGVELARRGFGDWQGGDDLATGDVDGDGKDEVIFADKSSDWINALSETLETEKRFQVKDFSDGDAIGAGDFDGDGIDEVVHADHSENLITIYDMDANVKGRFSTDDYFDLTGRDEIATGDVNLDGVDELIVATQDRGNDGESTGIHVFAFKKEMGQYKQQEIAYFTISYRSGDRIAAGDVNADGVDEIVWASQTGVVKVYNMWGDVLNGNGLRTHFERGAGLAVGDVDGNSIRVGPPKKGTMEVTRKVLVVINSPPIDYDVIPKEETGVFYSQYKGTTTETVTASVTSVVDMKFTMGLGFTFGVENFAAAEFNLKTTLQSRTETVTGQSFTRKEELTLTADGVDGAIYVTSYYDVYEFPIISPPELAVINGERQYVMVSVPKGPPTITFAEYDSKVHVIGDITTYPTRIEELEGFEASNLLGTVTIEAGKVGSRYRLYMKQLDWKGNTNTFTTTVSVNVKAEDYIAPGVKMSMNFEGNYMDQTITTHRVEFSNETEIVINYNGRIEEPEKRYTATGVIYRDGTDGHLVLDFYLSGMGDYYRTRQLSPFMVNVSDVAHMPFIPPWYSKFTRLQNLYGMYTSNKPPECSVSPVPVSGKQPLDVTFELSLSDPNNDPLSWRIDFGDGTELTGNSTEVLHTYADPGSYPVKLTVYDRWNANSTCSATVNVQHNERPSVSFTYSPAEVRAGVEVSFEESSSDPDGNVVSWEWDFGDGTASKERNPVHVYRAPGTYTVSLTVMDSDGMRNSYSMDLVVLPRNLPPMADFTFLPKEPRAGEEVSFVDKSYDSDGNIVSWSWDFGDGSTSNEAEPTHVFSSPGNYTVTLTVRDEKGGEGVKRISVIVGEAPSPTQSSTSPPAPEETTSPATSSSASSTSSPERGTSTTQSGGTCGVGVAVLLPLLVLLGRKRWR